MLHLTESSPQGEFRSRFASGTVVILVIFSLLLARSWYLQIFQGRIFKDFSEKNFITIKKIPAMRGRILDRNGVVIADRRPSFDLLWVPGKFRKTSGRLAIDQVAELLSWKVEDRARAMNRLDNSLAGDQVVLKRDLSRDELAIVLAKKFTLPGIEVEVSPARSYAFGTHGSHLLGYIGEMNRNDLQTLKKSGDAYYQLGDVWGISGIEKAFELHLRGENGARPFVEDASGREIGEEFTGDLLPAYQKKQEVAGYDLVLALDSVVQEAAEAAFDEHAAGAVVAINPKTGDVLALLSRPEYAPDKFVRGVSGEYWSELMKDPLNPLYDRALRGLYPPASTFKIITGAAALEENVTNPDETMFCGGSYRLGRETKRCWKKEGHGYVNFHKAMVQSCDVYFYEVGRRLGIERIAKYARGFGLGKATGIGINREENGLVPTEEWKKKVYSEPWVGGETLSVAIGQGALQTTPIQMALAIAGVGNKGVTFRPRIALRTQSFDGKTILEFPVEKLASMELHEKNWRAVLESLRGVVNEPHGTAYWHARSQLIQIGGKTGTAQVVGRKSGKNIEDHAWFVAMAPIDDPQIVVAVIVENGGHGGSTAAPIAKKVIEAYLGKTS